MPELYKSNLHGKTVLVTGGSMGIGLSCARTALQCGARVAIAARNEAALRLASQELSEIAGDESQVAAVASDVSHEVSVEHLWEECERRIGAIDAVIHAAAILGPIAPITSAPPDEWFQTLEINLFGTFLVVRRAARAWQARNGGRIVVLSGGGASSPFPNYSAYACSKVGVVRLIETVAQEMATWRIEINCLAPGFVATRMHEATLQAGDRAGRAYLNRTRQEIERGGVSPEVAANAATFLISDAAQGITGKFIAAVHDDWKSWPGHLVDLNETDIFTLRRILPKDRGMSWQ